MKKMILCILVALAMALSLDSVAAQSVATRTPNLTGGWTAPPGVVQFNFLHRYSMSDAPLRKITNTPTFMVGTGIADWLMAGFTYGSNSALVPAYPNEWELYARALPLSRTKGAPVDVSAQAGYNLASESVDGEILVARGLGRLKLLAAGRAFSEGYEGSRTRYAVAGGASLRLTSSVSLGADYGVLLDRVGDEPAAWGAGIQLGVPFTPHSVSIHATNVGTASLEGASRGTRTRWGFEYTVPITPRRYLPRGGGDDHEDAAASSQMRTSDITVPTETSRVEPVDDMMASADTVRIDIANLNFSQADVMVDVGTTVVWTNRDPLHHSVTAEEGGFDSDLIDPRGSFALTFDAPGTYAYHCTPHPFMQGRVVVREMMEERR
ncbi:MAG: cupredoxin family copper-binding protein [Gemmatimonadota bacterium]